MPEKTKFAAGTPAWLDLTTTDPAAAKDFYAQLFGWTYSDEESPMGPYSICLREGKPVCGLMAQSPDLKAAGAPSMWNTYVAVADCDASTASAKDAGANVMMEPMDVMDAGRMSVVQDPSGAFICIWQSTGENDGANLVNEHGAFTWAELLTADQDAAANFYATLFGWDAQDMPTPDGEPAKFFLLGGAPVASSRGLPMEGMPPHWFNYFGHDDVDKAASTIIDAGGTIMMEPFDTPPGRIVVAQDSTGGAFAAITLNPDFNPLG